MNEIKIFENAEFGEIRTIEINGEPWLVGKDIGQILGYDRPDKALEKHVDEDDKLMAQIRTSGQNRNVYVINESGLYSLILSSKLPSAKKFKHWVTSDVLPTIRKHGLYAIDDVLANPDTLIQALTELKKERKLNAGYQQTIAVQNQQIAEMQPKASYYDVVLNCKDLVAISSISKDYGWSATKMNRYLHEKGIQYKQGDIWLLYQKHAEKGYTSTKIQSYNGNDGHIHTRTHTYWTQKGRLFIYELLKADEILPLIECEEV